MKCYKTGQNKYEGRNNLILNSIEHVMVQRTKANYHSLRVVSWIGNGSFC